MYSVRWVIDLLELSLCEVCKCVITVLFLKPENNLKKGLTLQKQKKGGGLRYLLTIIQLQGKTF